MLQQIRSVEEETKDLSRSIGDIERELYGILSNTFIARNPLRGFKTTTPFDVGYIKVKFDKPATLPALVITENFDDLKGVNVHLHKHELYGMYIYVINRHVSVVNLYLGPNPETVEEHNMPTNDHALAYIMYPEVRVAVLKAINEGRVKASSLEAAVWLKVIADTSKLIDRDGVPKHITLGDILDLDKKIDQFVVSIKDFSEHVRKMKIDFLLDHDKNTEKTSVLTSVRVDTDNGWARFTYRDRKPIRGFNVYEVPNPEDKEMSKKLVDEAIESVLKLAKSDNVFKEIRKVLRNYVNAQLKLYAASKFAEWLWNTKHVEDILNQARREQTSNTQ